MPKSNTKTTAKVGAEVEKLAFNTPPTPGTRRAAAKGKPVIQPKTTIIPTAAANGATDNAPHTKRAVMQNAEAVKVAKRDKDALFHAKYAEAFYAEKDAKMEGGRNVFMFVPSSKGDYMKWFSTSKGYPIGAEQYVPKAAPAPKAEAPAKEKAAPKAKVAAAPTDRAYAKGDVEYTGKPDTWTHYMVTLTLKHKSTAKAVAAHKAGKTSPEKPLDFKWMDAKGYIKFM